MPELTSLSEHFEVEWMITEGTGGGYVHDLLRFNEWEREMEI